METGVNLVYVSKHWGARNTGEGHANHEKWQGRVYFIKEGKNYASEAERIGQDYITAVSYTHLDVYKRQRLCKMMNYPQKNSYFVCIITGHTMQHKAI